MKSSRGSDNEHQVYQSGWLNRSAVYSDEDWSCLAAACIRLLEKKLNTSLAVDMADYGTGFSVDVRSAGIEIAQIRGIVGADIVGDSLCVRAWLFFYAGNEVLRLHSGEEFLLLQLESSGWHECGWYYGELGEYERFTQLIPG
tara:strand:- start:4430 stop:4858 length:429 start_codon:yes stop_codon:yes gene_type:complete